MLPAKKEMIEIVCQVRCCFYFLGAHGSAIEVLDFIFLVVDIFGVGDKYTA